MSPEIQFFYLVLHLVQLAFPTLTHCLHSSLCARIHFPLESLLGEELIHRASDPFMDQPNKHIKTCLNVRLSLGASPPESLS